MPTSTGLVGLETMAWAHIMQRQGGAWAARGIDLLFPPRCASCHQDLAFAAEAAPGRALLCDRCLRDLAIEERRCLRCGERHETPACRPGRRHGRDTDWDGIVVLGGYADRLREAVLRCKRPAGRPLVRALAQLLAARHAATFKEWATDLVVPVPMHWWRAAVRGMNAADELAHGLARALDVPCRTALRRRIATRMQNEVPVAERRANVRDAFGLRARVEGRRVLLVDDVCTTGSTLGACRRALLQAGAAAVHAAVIAKAEGLAGGGPRDKEDE